jgi:hypothetical protein
MAKALTKKQEAPNPVDPQFGKKDNAKGSLFGFLNKAKLQ